MKKKLLLFLPIFTFITNSFAQLSFAPQVTYGTGSNPGSVFLADFNNDGNIDLVSANGTANNVSVLLGSATGTFAAAVNYATGNFPMTVCSEDFNGDGNKDLAVVNYSSHNVSVMLGTGTGSFSAAVNYAAGTIPRSVCSADFNNDGKLDLAVSNSAEVLVLLGSGTGTFSVAVNYPTTGSGLMSIYSADFNGDGNMDLVAANNSSSNLSVLLGNGSGAFNTAVNYTADANPRSVFSADFNGDGYMDIAAGNFFSNNVSVLLASSSGTFSPAVNYAVGSRPIAIFSADYNGDGKLDLATVNNNSNNISILLGNGVGGFSAASNYPVGANAFSIFSSDINNDSKFDLVVANAADHNVSVLLNTSIIPGAALNFDGVNDRVSINNSITNSFTIETYIKTSTPSATGTFAYQGSGILDADVPGVANDFILSILNNRIAFWDGSSNQNVTGTTTVTDGTWKHVAITRAAGGQIRLYVNGVLEATGAAGASPLNALPTIYFGNNVNAGIFSNISMDETRIWNRVLCQAEIQNNMNGELPPGQFGLLAYYKYNQGISASSNATVTTLNDASGNANNGTLSNFALAGTTSNWISPGAVISGSNVPAYASTIISISGANSICSGASTTFTASGAVSSYTWISGPTTATISVSPTVTTTYSVVGTNGVGCISNIATKTLTVNPLPTASITGVAVICAGQSTTLTATGGTSYAWSTGATTPTINVSVGGSYTSTITNVEGCSTATVRTVVVNPLPTPAISGLNTICVGQTTTLTATGGGTYLWSNGATTSTIAVNPTVTTLYTATVTSASGCTATASRNVTVNNLPSASITGIASICEGQSTTLTATGGVSYLWNTGNNTAAINVSPSVDAAYTATVTNASGCTATAVRNVTVNALPTASITGTAEICNLQSTVLTATGGSSYVWSTGATTSTISVNPSTNTAYTSTVTSAAGCTTTATRIVTVNPLPTPAISGLNTICVGQTTTLTATGGGTYLWSNGATTSTIAVNPTVTTLYTATVTSALGCTATASRNVTVNNLPTPNITGIASICEGQSTTLTASGGVSYMWNTGANTTAITVSPINNTAYTATVTNASGCSATAVRVVTVNTLPVISVNSGIICSGATFTILPSGADTYTISGGNSIVSPTSNATYSVSGTDLNGCVSNIDAVANVTVNALPTITVNSGSICAGQLFTITPSGADTYTISGGNSIVSPTSNATYSVSGTDLNGCVSNIDAVANVTVNALPTITVNSGSICAGQSFTLTPSGADTYTISGGNSIVSPTTNATYSVSGTDLNGCVSNTDAVANVTVNTLPVISIPSATICSGATGTLTASGATTYTWNTGSNASSISASPVTTTTYIANGTSSDGCVGSAVTATITVGAAPSIVVNSATVCAGRSATLNASGVTTYTWNTGENSASIVVTPTANTTYSVSGNLIGCGVVANNITSITVNALPTISVNSGAICIGQSFTMTPSGAITYTYSNGTNVVTPSANDSYTITGTDANGCVSETGAISTVTVNALPTISVNSGTICVGQSFTLSPSGADTYTISGGSVVVSPTVDATYNITGTDANGCVSATSATASVTVNPLPTISVNSGTICAGQSFTLSPSGANTYTFSGGNSVVSPTSNATYSVSGTDLNGCVSTIDAIASVTVNALPIVSAITNNSLLCVGETATLTASGASTYTWSTSQNSAIITVSPSTQTTYTLIGTDANGCENSTSITQNVNACTGINEASYIANELLVYPNPSNGEFNVNVSTTTKITILDVIGKVVYTEQLESGLHSVNLNPFTNGIYLLKAESYGNTKTIRLIKE